jgi:hypothetical protein
MSAMLLKGGYRDISNDMADGCRFFKNKADFVEVKRGEWFDKPTGAYHRMQSWCSACGKHSGIGGIESNRHKPFCPNCGADMRKEGADNG